MLIRVLLFAVLIADSTAHADSMSEAFSAGNEFGRSRNTEAHGQVTGEAASTTVPNYTTNPPEASLYGSGDLNAPAAAAISNCAGASGSSYADQACNATNYSQTNPGQRPSFTIEPGDPLVTRSNAIANDPQAIAGNIAGTYSSCTTQTITGPEVFETRVCNQYRTMEQQSCEKVRMVNVSWSESCTPGTWFGNFWVNTWGNGEVGRRYAGIAINAYCEPNAAVRMGFHAICTEGPCSGYAEVQVHPATGAIAPQTFANFIGRSWFLTDIFNRVDYKGGGCTSDRCSFSFCTRYEATESTCSEYCQETYVNETRACGTFTFERPRSVATVTDSWDNQCATVEARTQ